MINKRMININERIFKILKGHGLAITAYDKSGAETADPAVASRFFSLDPNLMVTIEKDQVRLSKGSTVELEEIEQLHANLRKAASEYMLAFDLKLFGKAIQPKDFSFEVKKQKFDMGVTEDIAMKKSLLETTLGKLFGRVKTSYQMLGEVKIIYKHTAPVNENSPTSRIRNVRSIAIESAGVKYAFPTTQVEAARAMARHLSEGGAFDDLVGQQIVETSCKYKKLREFARYVKENPVLQEANASATELVLERMQTIKETFKKFAKTKDYSKVKEAFEQQRLVELQDDARNSELRDQLTVRKFDETIADVLPLITSILKEKEDFETAILEEISKDVYVESMPALASGIAFESRTAELAHVLAETARCLENVQLRNFFTKLAEGLKNGRKLSVFESDCVRSAIGKIKQKEAVAKQEDMLSPEDEILSELIFGKEEQVTENPLIGMAARAAGSAVAGAVANKVFGEEKTDNDVSTQEEKNELTRLALARHDAIREFLHQRITRGEYEAKMKEISGAAERIRMAMDNRRADSMGEGIVDTAVDAFSTLEAEEQHEGAANMISKLKPLAKKAVTAAEPHADAFVKNAASAATSAVFNKIKSSLDK